jgi:hypothetical protein
MHFLTVTWIQNMSTQVNLFSDLCSAKHRLQIHKS